MPNAYTCFVPLPDCGEHTRSDPPTPCVAQLAALRDGLTRSRAPTAFRGNAGSGSTFAGSYSGAWSLQHAALAQPNPGDGLLSTFATLVKRTINEVGRMCGRGRRVQAGQRSFDIVGPGCRP
jgi:hypothetical protein